MHGGRLDHGRRLDVLVPFALLFGVGDGGGYLLGTAFRWSVPDNVSNSKRAAIAEQESKSHWGIWVLPWALSTDNTTYAIVDGVPRTPRSGSRSVSRRCQARSRPVSGS